MFHLFLLVVRYWDLWKSINTTIESQYLYYRPQTKLAKVLFIGEEEYLGRHSPWQVHPLGSTPPPGRYPLQQVHSPGQVHSQQVHPQAITPPPRQVHLPPGRYTSPEQVQPPGRYNPLAVYAMIRSTSGRYASYWKALFFSRSISINLYSFTTINCYWMTLMTDRLLLLLNGPGSSVPLTSTQLAI